MSAVTLAQFKEVVPKQLKRNVTPEIVDKINNVIDDPIVAENFRDNLMSFTNIMKNGRFKLYQYINAVKYVSYKMLGQSNLAAWSITFPDTYQRLEDKGVSRKDMNSYVSAYNKSKLVNLLWEQTFVPTCVLNAEMFQEALNVQADLMLHANSEKVRSDSANSILTHLKRPEIQKLEVDIGIKEDGSIQALRASTMELVRQQRKMIEEGHMSVKSIAESNIIEIEATDVSNG